MSSANNKPTSDAVSSVEIAINELLAADLPIKSLTVIHDVVAGVIMGAVGEIDHEQELAAGASYLVIGLGQLPTSQERGINFIDVPS